MEEQVGRFWHRFVTSLADDGFPQAKVELAEIERTLGVLFRALGGDGGLEVTVAEATDHQGRRSWLQRLAGSNEKVSLAWRDEAFLRLPPVLACFPDRTLNKDLYLWLTALAVGADKLAEDDWLARSQRLTINTLERFAGLRMRYGRLVAAHLQLRPDPASLSPDEAAAEMAIRSALTDPGSVDNCPPSRRPPAPVPLWLHPFPPGAAAATGPSRNDPAQGERPKQQGEADKLRRSAERVEEPEENRGLVTIRMENIFTWGEFVKVDRGTDDEDDLARAESVARDIDRIALGQENNTSAATLKFDLDLPAEAEDDHVIGEGIRLPEWDWKHRRLLPDHCRIVPMMAADAGTCDLPLHLHRTARRLRNQFQALAPSRIWQRQQSDGQEVDLDAYLRYRADRESGQGVAADGLYRNMRSGARDLACLLMADLSLSTDTWINDYDRVIDVIRDSLFLFAESLSATGDRFGMYGFSSRKRDPVRVHQLKNFEERYSGVVRGRIQAIKPGYYTRMGAAVRYASQMLSIQPANRRLLLLLTDGKPNDLDRYEGRHGIEDTRRALIEARQTGLQPFCVTIDEKANDYLPHLFGSKGYVVIRNPAELPRRLPALYAQLTA